MRPTVQAERPARHVLWVLLAVVAVVGLWLCWAYFGIGFMYRIALAGMGIPGTPDTKVAMATAGQVGDLFGGVNALFAALACVGIFWAGWLQRQQLNDARQAYTDERAASERKDSEAYFFQLLAVVSSMAAGLQFRSPFVHVPSSMGGKSGPDWYSADDLVRYALHNFIGQEAAGNFPSDHDGYLVLAEDIGHVIDANRPNLAPFFRVAFQLFVWLDERQDMPPLKKSAYADIARAQISGGLATLLGLFAVSDEGRYFHDAVQSYGLLEHTLSSAQTHVGFRTKYAAGAFGQPSGHRA